MLLDPATKPFAGWLLGHDLHVKTKSLLRMKHQEAYVALKDKKGPQADVVLEAALEAVSDLDDAGLEEPKDIDSEDEDVDGPSILLEQETSQKNDTDFAAEADEVFDSWINFSPKFGDYLIEGAAPLVTNAATGKVTFRDIVSKFDTRKYFRNHGLEAYPSITLLAMIHFSTMFNGGFQERTFSSCKYVMGVDQARIPMETLEMKALLFHNADLIRKGII